VSASEASSLTIEQVRHVAQLARLKLSPDEEQKTLGQLQQILEAIATLEQLDTSGVAPTYQVNLEAGFTRPDVLEPPLGVERALQNAPQRHGSHFAVPKTVE
jgi:aspartyl-tRNA(Asn)/glutamyl-tRNA(Gln) amidotransferase subunit C